MSKVASDTKELRELAERVEALLEKHIQRCRDGVAACPRWSPAQAEWSRARDALLNFQDDLRALAAEKEKNDG